MQEHVVHLLRIEGTADDEWREPDQAAARELHVAPAGDIQPVSISGDFGLEVAHAQVDDFATACRPDWETLYQLVR